MSSLTDNNNDSAFKLAFNGTLLQQMADSVTRYFPPFNAAAFLAIGPLLADKK